MKTIIAGGREFTDGEYLTDSLLELPWVISEVVSGTCRGADRTGESWATKQDINIKRFPAKWNPDPDNTKVVDRGAGFKRNVEMARYAEGLVAFWDGKSVGTKHMIDEAIKRSLYIKVFLI